MHSTEAGRYISDILSSGDLDSIYHIPTDSPPSYHDSIADLPPTYDLCEGLISVQLCSKDLFLPPHYSDEPQSSFLPSGPMTAPDIDLTDTSNFRQAAGKKKKQQAKAANQAKWADGGDEGSKDGGDGEENGEGGGGNNNGDGGAGDGGGGGDDWNNWDTGKKKKGKKAKEEEKKKQEDEEAEEAKKKEEEEAAKKTDPLSWADEANGDLDDDWGGFSTTKKDKKKKGKVR